MGELKRLLVVAFAVGVSFAGAPSLGWAECGRAAQPPTPKQSKDAHTLVFVGDVLGFEDESGRQTNDDNYRGGVRFRILEAFKGVVRGEQVMQFEFTLDDFVFEIGQRVLVYATPREGKVDTACGPTRKADLDDPEVRQLRELVLNTK